MTEKVPNIMEVTMTGREGSRTIRTQSSRKGEDMPVETHQVWEVFHNERARLGKTGKLRTFVDYEFRECINPDPELIKRASELIKATESLMNGVCSDGFRWLTVLTLAIDRAYAGFPQTWSAWRNGNVQLASKEPDETVLFQPNELGKRDRWIVDHLSHYEIIVFQAPLEAENLGGTRYVPPIPVPAAKSRT
jgi:hypothetical protein